MVFPFLQSALSNEAQKRDILCKQIPKALGLSFGGLQLQLQLFYRLIYFPFLRESQRFSV